MRALAIAAVAVVAIGCAGKPSGDVAKGPGGPGATVVVAANRSFSPKRLHLVAGEKVSLEFRNQDKEGHNLVLKTLGINTGLVPPGGVVTARFVVPAGDTEFVCTLHRGMKGVIDAGTK